uniref:Uncharacterized protein n=1 Tax=Gopherus evgoodei TaxID=1825980 RepID=A0A8C4WFL8_9SAUR
MLTSTIQYIKLCISCLLFLSAWKNMSGSGKLPPRPVAFPITGNALQLNTKNLPPSVINFYPLWTNTQGTKVGGANTHDIQIKVQGRSFLV